MLRAEQEAQNPDSRLNVLPRQKFSSRYADPSHAVNKGGPLAVLTGGKISFDNRKREKQERENLATGRPKDQGTDGVAGAIKRKLQEVCYVCTHFVVIED